MYWWLYLCIVQQLENSLNEFGEPWKLDPGDGAFYGPKVRLWQCWPHKSHNNTNDFIPFIFFKRLLFATTDRYQDQGRHRALSPVCHHPAGLPAASSLQLDLHGVRNMTRISHYSLFDPLVGLQCVIMAVCSHSSTLWSNLLIGKMATTEPGLWLSTALSWAQ